MTMDPQGAPHDSAAAASVGPGMVRLFDPDGEAFDVPAGRVDYWLGRGMSRERFSLEDAADGLPHLFDATKRAWAAYVKALADIGDALDTGEDGARATAHRALDLLVQQLGRVEQVASARPVAEAEPVTLRTPVGEQVRVDPRQVEHYQASLGATIASGTPHEEQADVNRSYLDAELASAEQAIADGEAAIAEHRARMAGTASGAPALLRTLPAAMSGALVAGVGGAEQMLDQREREVQQWRDRRDRLRQVKEAQE